MAITFKVTGLGLQVDKAMIMPGSELILSRTPPAHWARFGTPGNISDKELVVASPDADSEAQKLAAQVKAAASGKTKTKKRTGLESQAEELKISFSDEVSDKDLIASIKEAKAA